MELCTEKVVMVCSNVTTWNGVQKICNGLLKSKHMEWFAQKQTNGVMYIRLMACSKVSANTNKYVKVLLKSKCKG
jgi:hypothetical protein